MPFIAPNPPAYVQEQGQEERTQMPRSGVVTDRTDRTTALGSHTDLTLHGLHTSQNGAVGIGGLSLSTQGLQRSLAVPSPPSSSASPAFMSPAALGHMFSANTPAPLQFTAHNELERTLANLGINDMDVVLRFNGNNSAGTIFTDGELFSHRLDVGARHARWKIHGEPINEFFNHITNGASTFSGVTLFTNGKRFDLSPSVTISSVIPGVTTTFSSQVGEAFSLTDGLRPTIGDGFLGEPIEARDPLELGEGRLFINSFQFPHDAGALATRLDFVHEGHHSSLLLATGLGEGSQPYNIVALRGSHLFNNGLVAGADALYQQRAGGLHEVGGEFTLRRETNRSFFEVGIGGHHYWQSQGSGLEPNKPSILELPQTGPELGFRLEWRR